MLVRIRALSARLQQDLAGSSPNLPELGQTSPNPTSASFGFDQIWPELGRICPNSTNVGPFWGKFGRAWPDFGRCWSESAKLDSLSVNLGRIRPNPGSQIVPPPGQVNRPCPNRREQPGVNRFPWALFLFDWLCYAEAHLCVLLRPAEIILFFSFGVRMGGGKMCRCLSPDPRGRLTPWSPLPL